MTTLDKNIGKWWRWLTWIGLIGIGTVAYTDVYDEYYLDYSEEYEATINFTVATIPLWLLNTIKVQEPYKVFIYEHPEYKNLVKPIIKQSLSNSQIESLADSYNRKLFNEIKNETFLKE